MHTCPECGQACTCNGDIDDIMLEETEAEDNCVCYLTCCPDYDSDEFYEDDEDDEDDVPGREKP